MASRLNDGLQATVSTGSVNLYDEQRCFGSSANKALAASLSGHNYNIVTNESGKDSSIYFPYLRHEAHFVDEANRSTNLLWTRKRRLPQPRYPPPLSSSSESLSCRLVAERKVVASLAQSRHADSYHGFQKEMQRQDTHSTKTSSRSYPEWQQQRFGDVDGRHKSGERLPVTDLVITRESAQTCKLTRNDPFYARSVKYATTYHPVNNTSSQFYYNTSRMYQPSFNKNAKTNNTSMP